MQHTSYQWWGHLGIVNDDVRKLGESKKPNRP